VLDKRFNVGGIKLTIMFAIAKNHQCCKFVCT